jgi:hypothetical protein
MVTRQLALRLGKERRKHPPPHQPNLIPSPVASPEAFNTGMNLAVAWEAVLVLESLSPELAERV